MYKKINCKEYKVKLNDFITFIDFTNAEPGDNYFIETVNRFEDGNIVVGALGLDVSDKKKISKEITKNKNYIDKKEEVNIATIEQLCNKIEEETQHFILIVNYDWLKKSEIKNIGNELKKILKKYYCNILIIANSSIKSNKKVPTKKDFENKSLIDAADVVAFTTETNTIIVKNKYGKIGILIRDDKQDI